MALLLNSFDWFLCMTSLGARTHVVVTRLVIWCQKIPKMAFFVKFWCFSNFSYQKRPCGQVESLHFPTRISSESVLKMWKSTRIYKMTQVKRQPQNSANSQLLSNEENASLVKILGPRCPSLATAVVQIYMSDSASGMNFFVESQKQPPNRP